MDNPYLTLRNAVTAVESKLGDVADHIAAKDATATILLNLAVENFERHGDKYLVSQEEIQQLIFAHHNRGFADGAQWALDQVLNSGPIPGA